MGELRGKEEPRDEAEEEVGGRGRGDRKNRKSWSSDVEEE